MLLATLLLLGGIVATAWGVPTALRAPMPKSLGGSLVAALGLAVALAAGARMLVPGFF